MNAIVKPVDPLALPPAEPQAPEATEDDAGERFSVWIYIVILALVGSFIPIFIFLFSILTGGDPSEPIFKISSAIISENLAGQLNTLILAALAGFSAFKFKEIYSRKSFMVVLTICMLLMLVVIFALGTLSIDELTQHYSIGDKRAAFQQFFQGLLGNLAMYVMVMSGIRAGQ
jgi:hypothetical protein